MMCIREQYLYYIFSHSLVILFLLNVPVNCLNYTLEEKINSSELMQLKNAKLLKTDLMDIKKRIEGIISHIDEWAIEKSINISKINTLLNCENIKHIENEINIAQNEVMKLRNEFIENNYIYVDDLDRISERVRDLLQKLKMLDKKFNKEIYLPLQLLGEFYDEHFQNIIGNKIKVENEISILFKDIEGKRNEIKLQRLLDDIIVDIKQENYWFAFSKFKSINNEEQSKYVVRKIYQLDGFYSVLKIAEEFRNVKQSFLVYKTIYNETKFGDGVDIMEKIVLAKTLIDDVLQYIDNTSDIKVEAVNMSLSLKEEIKTQMKIYLWKFISDASVTLYDENIPIKLIELDSELFVAILQELFDEIHHYKDRYESNFSNYYLYSNYLNVIKKLLLDSYSDINSIIFTLAYLIKNQDWELVRHHYNVNVELEEIKLNLPSSVRNIVFHERVCIQNRNYNSYLVTSQKVNDVNKTQVFIGNDNYAFDKWVISHKRDNIFFITNVQTNQNLYADTDYYKLNGRDVYTSLPTTNINDNVLWKIEPSNDICFIKNVLYNEYLFAERDTYANVIPVFTGKSVTSETAEWFIEKC